MADTIALNAILVRFLLQNGFLNTGFGKTTSKSASFFQQIQAKYHFKKFLGPKWPIQLR
jgi:hypothetical protein